MATYNAATIDLATGLVKPLTITTSDAIEAIDLLPASETLTAGDFINIWNDGGTAKARKADNSNGRHADGFVKAGFAALATASVYRRGVNDQLSGMTPGVIQFLGTTGGRVETAPSGTGKYIQRLGTAKSATEMDFERVNPVGPLL